MSKGSKKTHFRELALAPSPAMLVESLRSIGYTLETALADLIDNSVTAEASTISVRFLWNNKSPWIAVVDDGCGMTPDELIAAMRFGSESPLIERSKNDLGRFGLGMKTASISQCRRVTVCSKSSGQVSACEWDLDRIADSESDEWLLGVLDDAAISTDIELKMLVDGCLASNDSGTIILWRNLDAMLAGTEHVDSEKKFSELMSNARSHLETVFHRFLSPEDGRKSLSIDFNKSPLSAYDPFGPSVPSRQELPTEKLVVEGETIVIQPFVLPHQNKVSRADYEKYAGEGGYLQNQGFYVYRNRRLIVKATWFRLIKKEELNKLVRVRIDIPNSLDHIWSINVDKSQVIPPEIVRKQLKNIIKRISGKGKQVYKRRASRLVDSGKVPVWTREVKEGNVKYAINVQHPLLKEVLDSAPSSLKPALESTYRMIADGFPRDVFFSDVASDGIEICADDSDEIAIKELVLQVLLALRKCGFEGVELRKRILETEIPGATEKLIDELLEGEE
ncbi:ATP-binding protein [Pontiellaceae bacterium B1224]|nr:ATP-binding protein [Pontiellaceae bacterium B1224]